MKSPLFASASALSIGLFTAPVMAQSTNEADPWKDVIVVHGSHTPIDEHEFSVPAAELVQTSADAAQLAFRIPGGAMNANGPLSGQVQYRGLYGYRIASRISGQSFASGGPNLMDPPMHYAPMPLLERMEFDRSFSPVSAGPGLVGGVNAVLKRGDFAASDTIETHLDASIGLRSINDSIAVGGMAMVGNERSFLHALVSHESGDDITFPGGTISSSGHKRDVYGLGIGFQPNDQHQFFAEYRRHETDPTGNPPFPMDIVFFNTDIARAEYRGSFEGLDIDADFGWSFVDHEMTNFKYRPAPASPAGFRATFASSQTWSYALAASLLFRGGDLSVGVDGANELHSVRITNPNNAAFVIRNFHHITENRLGGFVQFDRESQGGTRWELGARVNRNNTESDPAVVSAILPPPVRGLAAAFNAANRSVSDTTFDLTARAIRPVTSDLDLRLGVARKNRTPNYVERYGWLPTAASAGLADGNIYVGDINLKPETAWIANIGLDWNGAEIFARPSFFMQRIDNYIQGTPVDATPGVINSPIEMIAAMNGDPTPLRFSNVDAELLGFDMDFGMQFNDQISIDGVLSLVKGTRRDVTDNLYRVAPARFTANLRYERSNWGTSIQTVLVAGKTGISQINEEQATDGHALVHLEGYYQPMDNVILTFGLENLFDTLYQDHLAAYNRVRGSDVALGARLPGSGRGVHVRLAINL